ncbi:MAG: hypothetical protein K2X87_12005 [Gemmataceae bacterium]|nr:hypothetical protein [Gemmataceae bacterium]
MTYQGRKPLVPTIMSTTHLAYTVDATTPRVLIFGHPRSGKTFLLGALFQAGEKQPETLGAEVADLSAPPRLELIRDAVYYDTDFAQSGAELIRTPIRLTPWRGGTWAAGRPGVVELLDCDGQAATAMMAGADRLRDRNVRGTLAAAVVRADVMVLVVGAAAGEKELDRQFNDFLFLLQEVEQRKQFRREVGGFPIALVLSRCDELAEPGDGRAEWEARVDRRRDYVAGKFEDYLRDADPAPGIQSPYLPFGRVDLTDYAVAVRWPKLPGEEHPPDEPYKVAELFRDVFAAAAAHRRRVVGSDRRLRTTVWAVLCTLWVLVAAALIVGYFQPDPADPGLADRVRAYREQDPPAAVRLAERNVARAKRTLAAFQADPGFYGLPEDLQQFVAGRLREVEEYQAYRAKLLAAVAPADARTLDDLSRSEQVLTADLALPAEYTWADTEAGRLRDKWLADVPPIRAAELAWYDWYQGLVGRAVNLSLTKSFDGDWRPRVGNLLADAEKPPFDLTAPLPGSAEVPQPRGGAVAYRVPYEFDRVYQARREWELARDRLLYLRDLADALALTSDPGDPARRALFVPPPGPGVDANALPGDRLAGLRREFPRPSALYPPLEGTAGPAYPGWELSNFPEPGRSVLAARVREAFGNGVQQVRGLVRGRLTADTPEGWAKVAAGLGDRPFPQWGELLRLLARLTDPAAPDPVVELRGFLAAKEFPIDPKGFEVAIPVELRVPPVVPAGSLTVTHTPRGSGPRAVAFRPTGEGTSQGGNTVYRFTPDGAAAFAYRPGDGLRAELPVRSGDQRFTLVWDEGGPAAYQFARLAREPKLAREGAPPEPATGVVLTPAAGSAVPRVPVLLPDGLR